MLYTKQQAADKINDIYVLTNTPLHGQGVNLPQLDNVLDRLNNRQVITLAYMVTESLGAVKDFNVEPTGFGDDFKIEPIREISLKLKMLILIPIGNAWTDDITMRLLALSGMNYDQSFFDHILESRYENFKMVRSANMPVIPEYQLFEEFIKAQNESI
jgi:hypothetical protein